MFPAICHGRALDSCLLAAVLTLSACASTGPGSPPSFSTGVEPAPEASAEAPSRAAAVGPVRSKAAAASAPSKPAAAAAVSSKRRTAPAKPRRVPIDSATLELEITRRLAHQPLAMALARRARYPQLADRIAAAVVYEAGRARISPSVLAAVLLIENAPMDTGAVSTEGAIGLMQVMPMHVGNYRCLSGDLLNVEANICHGARLLHNHIRRAKSIELALRRYNGCVRGRNTPRCQRYPGRVLRTAARLRREILVTGAKLQGDVAANSRLTSSRLGALPPDLDADSAARQGK
jgi:soluble lytic murein transglycosylase-like protein